MKSKEQQIAELIARGSQTAKGGFKNEQDVVDRFNNWKKDAVAQEWLGEMNYKISEVESVNATKVKGRYKADVEVKIKTKNKEGVQKLQIKLVSNPQGFNQVDKRWVENYVSMWDIPEEIARTLKLFTGEIKPEKIKRRSPKRMFLDEMNVNDVEKLISFMNANKTLVVSSILKGSGEAAADWTLVILKLPSKASWVLKPIDKVISVFGEGDVRLTPRGSLKIGKIGMQRKGGDNGRDTAKMLQFKINPVDLFNN